MRQGGYDPATGRRWVKQLGTFTTKREATAHRKAAAAGRLGSDDETLAEFLEESWLPSEKGRVEQSTLDQYGWAVRLHMVPLLGAGRLRDQIPEVVDGWVAELVPLMQERLGHADIGITLATC